MTSFGSLFIMTFSVTEIIISSMIKAQETGSVKFNGITFSIPEGWVGSKQEGVYLLGSHTEPGLILVVPASFKTMEQIEEELNKEQTDGSTIFLQRVKDIEKLSGNAMGAEFEGNIHYEPAKMFVSGIIPGNIRGILIYSGTITELYSNRYRELASQIINSISIQTAPVAQAKNEGGQSGNDWEQFYGNTRLTYLDSYYSSGYGDGAISGGYSNKIVIDLCAQGFFTYRNDFELSGGSEVSSFGTNDAKRGSGTWSIKPYNSNSATLILTFYDGKTTEYSMKYDEKGITSLNGDRFYKTTMGDGTEYQPQCF